MLEVKLSPEDAESGADAGRDPLPHRRRPRVPQSPAPGLHDHAALVRRPGSLPRAISAACASSPSNTASHSSRWACPTTWKPPSKKVPPACAWAPRSSERGQSVTVGFFSPLPPAPHRRGRLCRRPPGRSAAPLGPIEIAPADATSRFITSATTRSIARSTARAHSRAWSAARRRASPFFSRPTLERGLYRRVRLQLRRVEPLPRADLWRARASPPSIAAISITPSSAASSNALAPSWSTIPPPPRLWPHRAGETKIVEIPHFSSAALRTAQPRRNRPRRRRHRAARFRPRRLRTSRESKRLPAVLDAFARVHRDIPAPPC